jgi:hypothetical protein
MTLLLRVVAAFVALGSIEVVLESFLFGPAKSFQSTTGVTRLLLYVPSAVTLIGAVQLWRLKRSGLLITRTMVVLGVLLAGAITFSSGHMGVDTGVGFAIGATLLVILFSPAAGHRCAR